MRTLKIAAAAALAVSAVFAAPAFAEYPEKPVSFVVPWPPGDLEDVITRIIAEDFQETYGTTSISLGQSTNHCRPSWHIDPSS